MHKHTARRPWVRSRWVRHRFDERSITARRAADMHSLSCWVLPTDGRADRAILRHSQPGMCA